MKTSYSILVLLSFILLFSCAPSAKKTAENQEKNIGLQLYSLRDPIGDEAIGIDSILRAVGEMGYKYVENYGYYEGLTYGLTPEELKAQTDAAGITVLSTHVRRDIPAETTEENLAALWAWWDKCIADHKAMGARFIVVPSMPTPETLEGLKKYTDYYNAIGERCNAAGLKFGYHNHAYEFEKVYDDGTVMYDYMVKNTDPEKVFFELDVYWCQKGGRPATELFAAYPGRFIALHIKDEQELGQSGYMNFEELFNQMEPSGAKYLFVEVERYTVPPVESVKQSLEYLNKAGFVKADYAE
jgi:sugar phosphate isomerase/epimerase